jgi:hypothetical protein
MNIKSYLGRSMENLENFEVHLQTKKSMSLSSCKCMLMFKTLLTCPRIVFTSFLVLNPRTKGLNKC